MAQQTKSVHDVIDELVDISAGLPPNDGVACFNRLYLAVTRAVDAAVQSGAFSDSAFVSRLDVDFADLYFAAVAADRDGDEVPDAWRLLFKRRASGGIAPLQFALAGMNAHINHDLPLALMTTWTTAGKSDLDSAAHTDFVKVNRILAQVEREVKATLESEELARVDDLLGKADDAFAIWSVARARDHAWLTAEALWDLRGVPAAEQLVQGVLERLVDFAGHGLLR